jgi:hypothetical protein
MPFHAKCPRRLILLLGLAACLLKPGPLAGQTFDASGGTSSFLNASGFQVDYQWTPVQGWVGLGSSRGLHPGGYLGTSFHGMNLGLGDRYYPFVLDTDVFDQTAYFDARGVTLSRSTDKQSWMLFGGASATELSAPFAHSFATGDPTGAFFYGRKLGQHLAFHSWNIAGSRSTSIQSLSFRIQPHWMVAAAGGIGSGSGYLSVASEYQYRWLEATGAYIGSGNDFQRIRVLSPLLPERTGSNLRLRLSPLANLNIQLDHQNIQVPQFASIPSERAALDSATVSTDLDGVALSGSLTASRAGGLESRTQLLSVTRRIGSRLTAFGSAVRISQTNRPPELLEIMTAEERIMPRLSIRETLNHTAGRTSTGWGGQFLSNRLTLGLDYETVFSPLAGGFGGRSFLQAWMVNVGIALPGGIRLHYQNFVDPFGKVRYTAYASGVRYARDETPAVDRQNTPVSLYRFIVRGIVQDEQGRPVWGIPVRVDGQTVFSDESGRFFLRLRENRQYPVSVLLDQSLSSAGWEVVSAPKEVLAEQQSAGPQVVVVLRRSGASPQRAPALRGLNP